MLLKFVEQDYIDKYGNYTDYNFDGQYEMTVDKFGCLIYSLKRTLRSAFSPYFLIYCECGTLPSLEIWVNSMSHVIEHVTIMPLVPEMDIENNGVSQKFMISQTGAKKVIIPPMEKTPPKIEILKMDEVILIELDECSDSEWKNHFLEIKDENLHFIYYELANDLYCVNSSFPSKLYSYKVCDLARILVNEKNQIYGVIFVDYKKARQLPNPKDIC